MILAEEGTKMSKSRGTQVDPDELVAAHGADALRLHLMYLGPWDRAGRGTRAASPAWSASSAAPTGW